MDRLAKKPRTIASQGNGEEVPQPRLCRQTHSAPAAGKPSVEAPSHMADEQKAPLVSALSLPSSRVLGAVTVEEKAPSSFLEPFASIGKSKAVCTSALT